MECKFCFRIIGPTAVWSLCITAHMVGDYDFFPQTWPRSTGAVMYTAGFNAPIQKCDFNTEVTGNTEFHLAS